MRLSAVIALALIAGCHDPRSNPTPAVADGAEVFSAQTFDVSPPLRELAKLPQPARPSEEEFGEMAEVKPNPRAARLVAADGDQTGEKIMQHVPGQAVIAATTQNFEGQGAGLAGSSFGGYPPDTDGAVGPNHYMQVVNTSLAVFSKTGSVVMGPMNTSMVWSGFAGICSTNGYGDGVARYDQLADRWVISQFAFKVQGTNPVGPFIQCIAISTTPDPTGTYTRYQYSFNNNLNDYPKIAMWPDAYYLTYNIFPNGGGGGNPSAEVCAMDRTKMIAGDATATTQCFSLANDFGLLVSDLDGKTLPPAGSPAHIIDLNDSTSLDYFSLHVDFATPANSQLSAATTITVPSYSRLASVSSSSGTLGSLGDRAMNRFAYRNFGDHESLVLSHSITAGMRWYEFRTPATPTLFQSGTYAPDATTRWMPSIALDSVGDIALVYSATTSNGSPSIRYTARQPSDPAGTLGYGEGVIRSGDGTQPSSGGGRWGDYASINIDPTDDCTFWATHEYYTLGKTQWSTRIASFTLPSCSSFALAQPDAETVAQGGTATYPVATTTSAGAAQTVALTATGLPAGVTASFNPASVMSGATSQITLTADPTATLGSASYQVVATGTTSSKTADVALTVTEKPATPDAGMNGSGDGGSQSGGCCGVSGHSSPAGALFLIGLVGLVLGRRRRR